MTHEVKVICAWCGKIIKDNEKKGVLLSHGICTECEEKFFPRQKQKNNNL